MNNIENLKNKELLERLEKSSDLILQELLVSEAKELYKSINRVFNTFPNLKKDDLKLYNQYKSMLAKSQFVFLFDITEGELLELIEHYLHLVLGTSYDIILNFKNYFKNINSLEERDELKSRLREKILNNKHKITSKKIKIGNIEQEPSISNWLKDYYSKLGIEKVDALKINQYLFNDENTKDISENERILLKDLFNFFEHLKKSSFELGGLEENFVAILPNGEISLIEGGVPVKIDSGLDKIIKSVIRNNNENLSSDIDKNKIEDILDKDDISSFNLNNNLVKSLDETNLIKESYATRKNGELDLRLNSLNSALANYSPSSLEYKAIKEEIGRIKKRQS